ncbi:MAG: magnesium/cobalt transporter CorA [Planctomycetes bacterium]|nr:magnesium/cobalt transporter CorA [Planctomycetota bacterium]
MAENPSPPAHQRSLAQRFRHWLMGGPPRTESIEGVGRLPGMRGFPAGAASGIERDEHRTAHHASGPAVITCTDMSPETVLVEQITDLDAFVSRHRPPWTAVRWINIDGLGDLPALQSLAHKYGLHPLVVEDVVHVGQRPKVEDYPATGEHQARLFLIARMLELQDGHVTSEQVSFALGHKTLLTFQESPGDVWDPIRQRISVKGSRLRQNDVSFLIYSLLDALVDQCFPILEFYSDQLEELEDQALTAPTADTIHRIHAIKRELLTVRRAIWPMREVINSLQRERHECMSEVTRTYLRDLYDNCVQIIDLVETYREFATGLAEIYMSALSIRMNEIMKVLTIMGTIFIPLTFLAGVYGMNMPIPENEWTWTYPAFWGICILTVIGMLRLFRRRGWL